MTPLWPRELTCTPLRLLLAVTAAAAAAPAQDGPGRMLQVRVTSISGTDGVFLDNGRSAGLRPGLEVELFPPGAPPLRMVVRDVAANSARATLRGPGELPPIGTAGEVTVPDTPDPRRDDATPRRAARVEHPPWTAQPLGDADDDAPLLAPAFGGGPASRPVDWDGRLFGQYLLSVDRGAGRDNQASLGRVGTRVTAGNLLGLGGEIRLDGELTRRTRDLTDLGADSDDRARLDQLSYAWGRDDSAAPWQVEAGRFVSRNAPELGLIDGAEAALRFGDDWLVGAGAGALPLPFPSRSTGDDFGAHAFAAWNGSQGGQARTWVGGYQKTWHQGRADRDLLFTRFAVSLTDDVRLDGSAKVDVYTASDQLKSSGPELTEAWLSTTWAATESVQLALNVSHYRWAEMRRGELFFAAADLIRDGEVQRASPRVRVNLADGVRLYGRADWWQDQTRDGLGGQLGVDLDDIVRDDLSVGAELFMVDGAYQDGPGLRLRARQRFGMHSVSARYEILDWQTDGLGPGDQSFLQHRIGASIDLMPAAAWSLRIDADAVLGDDQNGYFLGTYAQWRF